MAGRTFLCSNLDQYSCTVHVPLRSCYTSLVQSYSVHNALDVLARFTCTILYITTVRVVQNIYHFIVYSRVHTHSIIIVTIIVIAATAVVVYVYHELVVDFIG